MRVTRQIGCCGIREIDGLQYTTSEKKAIQEFLHRTKRNRYFRFVIFSQADGAWARVPNYGVKFAAFIETNKLGTLTMSNTAVNPNTGNKVTVWIWSVDWDALKKWAKENPVAVGTIFPQLY